MGQTKFEDRSYYESAGPYKFLPFQFLQFNAEQKILVNQVGEHLLVNDIDFDAFVNRRLDRNSDTYLDLKGKHFLFDSSSAVPFELLSLKYRTKKSFLAGFTKLHIFVVSLRCEHSCHYCQVSRVSPNRVLYDMSPETATKALALVFRSPANEIKIEFQGGEPLLNFERIVQIVDEAERMATDRGKNVEFVVTTNLALVTDEMLEYFRDHNVFVSTSLDGPAFIHNANRPRPDNNSYELTVHNLERARAFLGFDRISALMTTTRLSLSHPRAIIDEYATLGFQSVFLRGLSPYGFAQKTAKSISYSNAEFLKFYQEALEYILQLNAKGTHLVETYAQIILTRILTPFTTGYVDLQSPAGAGIGVAVYNYDGDVYASDESRMLAEMNDSTFKLGNVHTDTYENIFGGELLQSIAASSVVESMPGCADCAFQSYCGADPIFNHATQGDMIGHRPTSEFHERNFFIIKHLLGLYHSSHTVKRIFSAWVQNIHVSEMLSLGENS